MLLVVYIYTTPVMDQLPGIWYIVVVCYALDTKMEDFLMEDAVSLGRSFVMA